MLYNGFQTSLINHVHNIMFNSVTNFRGFIHYPATISYILMLLVSINELKPCTSARPAYQGGQGGAGPLNKF